MPHIFTLAGELKTGTRVLDVGCGNGYTAGQFLERGCTVVGIDLSESGIGIARKAFPKGRFDVLPADENILLNLDEKPFDLVVSTEVVEHLYAPRPYVQGCFAALRPGGRFICTTPYHGYLKKLGDCTRQPLGSPCKSPVGRRSYQTVEPKNTHLAFGRGRFR